MIAMQFNCNCTCQHEWIAQDMPINCPKCGVRTISWKRERANEGWEQNMCAGVPSTQTYMDQISKIDNINHPPHYTQGKIECIDFIEDQKLGYHLGNAVAYIVRCRWKGETREDIKKAIWYLNRYLAES